MIASMSVEQPSVETLAALCARGLTQTEIGRLLGCSPSWVSRLLAACGLRTQDPRGRKQTVRPARKTKVLTQAARVLKAQILAGTFQPSGKVRGGVPLRWKPPTSAPTAQRSLHVPPRVPLTDEVPPEQDALYDAPRSKPQPWPALQAKLAREAAAAARYAHVQPRGTQPVRLPDMLDLHVAAQLWVSNLDDHSPVGAVGIECREYTEPTRLYHLYADSRLGWALQKARGDG